jgi:hypothetical protein
MGLCGTALYTYSKDTKPGDTIGEGVAAVWHVARPERLSRVDLPRLGGYY